MDVLTVAKAHPKKDITPNLWWGFHWFGLPSSSEVSMNLGVWRRKEWPNYLAGSCTSLEADWGIRTRAMLHATIYYFAPFMRKRFAFGWCSSFVSFLSSALNPLLNQGKSGLNQRGSRVCSFTLALSHFTGWLLAFYWKSCIVFELLID